MSNDIKNWAKRQTVGERCAKVVFLEIADVANDDGYSWYSIPTIAATLEASPKTVERGIAYLKQKGFITRTEREKNAGKFTSRGTQINIPEDDWAAILETREARKAKKPTDKMTDGKEQPTDNLSHGEQKPTDKMTDGGESQQTICPKPTDNLSNGQNDALYIRDKELISEPLRETEERESSPALVKVPEGRAADQASVGIFERCEALEIFEKAYCVTVGPRTASEIRSRIKNLSVWKALIRDKIVYADKPLADRERIASWIFSAYEDRLKKDSTGEKPKQVKELKAGSEVLLDREKYKRISNSEIKL